MLRNLKQLVRYRALIQSLVARDLKARYRGSVLGFCWSFVNPLLLLLIYTFVFTVVFPGAHPRELEPFALFMFCGILPWTWFASSLLESSSVLVSNANLLKKVLFPAEVLPIVTTVAGLVNFCLGLPILAAFLLYYRIPVTPTDLLWLPLIVGIQLVLTTGLALLVSALTVHFRDVRDLLANLLTLWFFATPIIYPLSQAPVGVRWALNLNPFTHLAVAYQEVLFTVGPYHQWPHLLGVGVAATALFFAGYFVFDRLRDTFAEEVWTQPMNAIEVCDLRKMYRRYGRRRQFATLKSALLSGTLVGDLRSGEAFEALKGVSFDVMAGRTFGVIGRNGSGKSTLLKMLAGIGKPSSGTVRVNGRLSALIELGAGFHPEISGRDNVFINGMMLGLPRRDIAKRFDEIVAFAELEAFIDDPVKTYSSGMYMRLGFAVAINVDPDVLLVDEVLAVGDEGFTHKCLDKFAEFRRRGKTVVIVTHSLDLVTRFCDEALWLDAGRARAQGDPKRVIDAYLTDVAAAEDRQLSSSPQPPAAVPADEPVDMFRASEGRWGSREVEIVGVDLIGAGGVSSHVVQSGDPFEIRLRLRAQQPVSDLVVGVGVFNADGVCCYGTNTDAEGATGGALTGEGEVRFTIDDLNLIENTYKLDVAVHRRNGAPYDYHRQLYTFRVRSGTKEVGVFRPPHKWSFSGGIRISGL